MAWTDYAIYMLDPTGVVSSWNPGAERIKGYRREEILGDHYSRFYTEEDRAPACPSGPWPSRRRPANRKRGLAPAQNGERFWASVVIDAIRTVDGTLVGFAKVTRDRPSTARPNRLSKRRARPCSSRRRWRQSAN